MVSSDSFSVCKEKTEKRSKTREGRKVVREKSEIVRLPDEEMGLFFFKFEELAMQLHLTLTSLPPTF